MIKVLISGTRSRIGAAFTDWASRRYPDCFQIDCLSLRDGQWRERDFSGYDALLHVAGLAQTSERNITGEQKRRIYAVNRDLCFAAAKKAREDGVKQFILLSSMSVYGNSGCYGKQTVITRDTVARPASYYGDSKWQADVGVRRLQNGHFKTAVLRLPEVYSPGRVGPLYRALARMAEKLPVFPNVRNARSLLFIDNLSELLCGLMLRGEGGVLFPQNAEYVGSADLVREIAAARGRKIRLCGALNGFAALASRMPGHVGAWADSVFGDWVYEREASECGFEYWVADLKASVAKIEKA